MTDVLKHLWEVQLLKESSLRDINWIIKQFIS